ncbi:MAG: dTDP-4-amino-4,6-dideoxygalactose transaminase [Chlamydiales bacterium]
MKNIYVMEPTLPEYSELEESFRDIISGKMLSNFAKYASLLELNLEKYLHADKVYTFPNATTALIAAINVLDLQGEIILPSFTFSATGHAVVWNNLTPIFADIDPETFNIDPEDVQRKITKNTSAILAVNIFGNPVDIKSLHHIAKVHKLKLIFDSSHALGSKYNNLPLGTFADLECFSLSGTKVITGAEGGFISSNKSEIMKKIALFRNYGANEDYNCQYFGLNGKLSEFHAALALQGLPSLNDYLTQRNIASQHYRKYLEVLPGIKFQKITENSVSAYKDLAILIDEKQFGCNRDHLAQELKKECIYTKKYFYPPLHEMHVYLKKYGPQFNLNHTESVSRKILCLPIFSHITEEIIKKICKIISKVHQSFLPVTISNNFSSE